MRLGADVIVFSRCCGKDGKRFVFYCVLLFFFLLFQLWIESYASFTYLENKADLVYC